MKRGNTIVSHKKNKKKITRKGKGENDNNIDRVFAMGFI